MTIAKAAAKARKAKPIAPVKEEHKEATKDIPSFLDIGKTPPGRPAGKKYNVRQIAEALMGHNGSKIVRTVLAKALDKDDKDQGMMLKLCLERILPPMRELNINHKKQTAISVVVEGIEQYSKAAIDVEDADIINENLEVEMSMPEEVMNAVEDVLEDEIGEDV